MIYYYIPDFFFNYDINVRLLELIQTEPDMFYDDFKIGAVFGNFPNCIWNGGRPVFGNNLNFAEMQNISAQFNYYGVPLRLTMTNPVVEETDVYDRYANYIMQNLNNGFNQVLVANSILEEYIREKYPEYPVIRSILASNEVYYDDSDKYFMSVLKREVNDDFELLKSIKNKDKIEILINETCPKDCKHRLIHQKNDGLAQLYKIPIDTYCPHIQDKKQYELEGNINCSLYLTRDKIKNIYEPMGFKHFKISGRGNYKVILDYAHYMVKPEHKDIFMKFIM